jgi:hypothetical protein
MVVIVIDLKISIDFNSYMRLPRKTIGWFLFSFILVIEVAGGDGRNIT